jgi:hypothetical protein
MPLIKLFHTFQFGVPLGPFGNVLSKILPPPPPELQLNRNRGIVRDREVDWNVVFAIIAKLLSRPAAVAIPNISRGITIGPELFGLLTLVLNSTVTKVELAAGPVPPPADSWETILNTGEVKGEFETPDWVAVSVIANVPVPRETAVSTLFPDNEKSLAFVPPRDNDPENVPVFMPTLAVPTRVPAG